MYFVILFFLLLFQRQLVLMLNHLPNLKFHFQLTNYYLVVKISVLLINRSFLLIHINIILILYLNNNYFKDYIFLVP